MDGQNTSASELWKREEQWAAYVVEFSSQYNDTTWAANQVIGPPRVYPRHGDINGAWAQGNRARDEFIVVGFSRAVYPEQIDIYETYNPGAVVRVSVRNSAKTDEWTTAWETETPHVEAQSRIFSVPCSLTCGTQINQVRLDVNCTAASNWCEIDSIKLIGHVPYAEKSCKELTNDLKRLLGDSILADITFQLDDGQTISAHRNILDARSIYFQELLEEYETNTNNEPIKIHNISHAALYQILHFIYTEEIQPVLMYGVCLELMRKADEYFLSPIYDQAFNILKQSLNKTNVLRIYAESGLFRETSDDNEQDYIVLQDVVNLCVEFVQKNRRDVFHSDQVSTLTKEMLLRLVQLVN